MKAVEISRPGGPDVLVPVERPMPEPGPGEVLIKVSAAGINRPDVFQRRAPIRRRASDLPGLEVAGEIVSGDAAAGGLAIGDKVCALVAGGGYAEYCVAPAAQCLPIPRGLSDIEAAGLPETYFTVWSNVFDRGRLAEGEALLVHGGASGIGTTAIQLARAMGNPVTPPSAAMSAPAPWKRWGARGINYKTQDFVKEVLDATGGRGVDVVLDMVAGDYIGRDIQCLADDGRIVIIAQLGGAHANGHGAGHASPAHHHRFHAASAPRCLQGRHRPRAARARLAVAGAGRHQADRPRHLPAGPGRPGPCHDGKRREHRQDHPDRIGKLGCAGTPAHNRIQSQVSPGIFPGRPVGECFMGRSLPSSAHSWCRPRGSPRPGGTRPAAVWPRGWPAAGLPAHPF